MKIEMKRICIDYNSKSKRITPPFDMDISIEKINQSDLLLDGFLSQGIDFTNFDNGDKVKIECSAFELNFRKEVYTYFLRILDLNVNYYD